MLNPTIAIVGRPNVGKSTLFNCLTKKRQALVHDMPGVTRDRLYGDGVVGPYPYHLVDTGGITTPENGIEELQIVQLNKAVEEADAIWFVVDGQVGLCPDDIEIAQMLRGKNKPMALIVNKTDGRDPVVAQSEFFQLGFEYIYPIAASHNRGIVRFIEGFIEQFPNLFRSEEFILKEQEKEAALAAEAQKLAELGFKPGELFDEDSDSGDVLVEEDSQEAEKIEKPLKIAIVGRPNVGKSTLTNRLLKEERVVVFDQPGTTRDSIYIKMVRHGKDYVLIDTAGVRRKSRIFETIEKFSVIKSFQAIKDANVTILLLNAREEVFDQDLRLLETILEAGCGVVVAINKWDGLDLEKKTEIQKQLSYKFNFAPNIKFHYISALHGTGVGDLFDLVQEAYDSATQDMSASKLTKILEAAVQKCPPPLSFGGRIKLRFAHCGGQNPPIIVIHGNQTNAVPDHYKKYLTNAFIKALRLVGTPLKIEYRSSDNPYKGKKNVLTPRQIAKRKRMMKHYKK